MTDDVTGGGLTPGANPPAVGGSGSGSGAKGSTVVYLGHEGRRFGSLEIEVDEHTWTFPRDREVEDVPQKVVEALTALDGHDFEISKGA